ncbi:MAG: C39 family peptidase [Ruthenibacterium sp.]
MMQERMCTGGTIRETQIFFDGRQRPAPPHRPAPPQRHAAMPQTDTAPPRGIAAQQKKRAQIARKWMRRRAAFVVLLMVLSFLLGRFCAALSYSHSRILSVEAVRQNPELPNGCEAASLAAALQYSGFEVSALALYREAMPKANLVADKDGTYTGPDPELAYAGNAQSVTKGWYCFEQPLAAAANAWLSRQQSGWTARIVTGANADMLQGYLAGGTPVIAWVTLSYEAPRYSTFHWTVEQTGETYVPYANLHCVLLTGMEDDTCYVTDPIKGNTRVPRALFLESYTAMGSRAVVLTHAYSNLRK